MKARRLDRALALTLLVLALVIAFVLPMFSSSGEAVTDSIESPEPDGRLALALLLERAGFEPEAWRSAPGRLPSGAHVVWAPLAPQPFGARFATADDADDEESGAGDEGGQAGGEDGHAVLVRRIGPAALALHDLAHYLHFVEGGGTLVLPAGERSAKFLRAVGLEALAAAALPEALDAQDDEASARIEGVLSFAGDDERIDVEWPEHGVLAPLAPGAAAEALAELEGVGLVAWSAPVGRGRVVVLGDDGFARNGDVGKQGIGEAPGLGRRAHGLLAVRLAERLSGEGSDGGGRFLFDEVTLGRWRPETALGLATSGWRGLLLVHIALLFVVLAWRAMWVREFPRDPEPLERVSPLARARAQASLYSRARRFDLLAGALRSGVLDGIARRLGRRPARGRATSRPQAGDTPAVGAPPAAGRAAGDEAQTLADELERVVATLGDAADRVRWGAAFLGPAPRDALGLAALGAELAALEREVAPPARSSAPVVRARRRASGIVPARATSQGEREPRPKDPQADRARPPR